MITVQSLSSIPTTNKSSITPSMDARLLRSPRSSNRINRSRSLVVVSSEPLAGKVDDSMIYHRHRSKLNGNMQNSLNASWKKEDPNLYAWATKQKKEDGNRNRSRDRKVSRSSSGARRLRAALSFNSKKKTSKVAASDSMPLAPTTWHGESNDTRSNHHQAKRGARKPKSRRSKLSSKVATRSDDPSSTMPLTSTTWHGENSTTPSNRANLGAQRNQMTGRSKSFRQDSSGAAIGGDFLAVPLHLRAVSKQPSNSPPKLRRSASARAASTTKDYYHCDAAGRPSSLRTLQRSTSARVSGQSSSSRLSCGAMSPPTMKRSTSARISRHSATSGRGPTSPTLERARSARISRSNSKQLRDFFGSFHHRSQSELQVTPGGIKKTRGHNKRRGLRDDVTGIFRDKEKGYISSFLGADEPHKSRGLRQSSGWLV